MFAFDRVMSAQRVHMYSIFVVRRVSIQWPRVTTRTTVLELFARQDLEGHPLLLELSRGRHGG
jgi:hypothetical protein